MSTDNIDEQKKLTPPNNIVEVDKIEDTKISEPAHMPSQTPMFTPEDADVNDMAKMELDDQDVDESDNKKKKEKPEEARDQIIQSVYLGDRPIIGGVKIARKNNGIFSKFSFPKMDISKPKKEKRLVEVTPPDETKNIKTEKHQNIPNIAKIHLPSLNVEKIDLKIAIPIILGLVLLALSAGAYFAIKTGEPQQSPQQNEQPVNTVTEPQIIRISGSFTFPSDINEDAIIKKMTEAETQPIKLSLININSISIDSVDSEILSIKFE